MLGNYKQTIALGFVAFLTASALPAVAAKGVNREGVDWAAGTISVVGEGAMPKSGSAGQRRLMAKRAAMVDGYRKLAEVVEGVTIDAQTSVRNFETESDEIQAEVRGLIKGAQATEENITSDNVYEVRLVLPLYGANNSLASAVLLSSLNSRRERSGTLLPSDEAETASGSAAVSGPAHTGVIVDAAGMGAKQAMAPGIVSESGQEIYIGKVAFDEQEVLSKGCVAYAKSVAAARENGRAGSNPLVLRPKSIKGPFRADFVLKAPDAQKLIEADQRGEFLKDLAVVIVM